MKNLTLYRNDPFDFIDSVFGSDEFFAPQFRSPVVDVTEEDNKYTIEAELPGLSEKDVKLELKNGTLTLSTEKNDSKEEKGGKNKWIRKERREFRFTRSFELPEDVDADKIEAKFRDGLLTVELPRKPESSARLVPVKVA